jgi:hypothetical protein
MCIPGTGNAMGMLNIAKKSLYMNTFEKFHIQKKKFCIYISKQRICMSETYTDANNLIYNLILQSTMPDDSTQDIYTNNHNT